MRLNFSLQRIFWKLASLVITLLLVAACVSSPSPIPTTAPATTSATHKPAATPRSPEETATLNIEVNRDIVYATVDNRDTKLDVVAPSQQGPWPVVVVVHGWAQTQKGLEPLARAIASQGAVVFNTDVAFTFPFLSVIERLACAVRFARATASDYDGDPNRIILVGNSMGAASGVVVSLAGDDFDGDCVVSDVSALPDALVAYEGPYDFATTNYNGVGDHTAFYQEDPELLNTFDPYSHIGRNLDVQIRLVHGEDVDDQWYEPKPEVSIELYKELAESGYEVELIFVDGASHIDLTNFISDAFTLMVQQVMELARSSSE